MDKQYFAEALDTSINRLSAARTLLRKQKSLIADKELTETLTALSMAYREIYK